jgi:hypothetical protein
MEGVVLHFINALSMNLYRETGKINYVGESKSFLSDLF